MKSLKSFITETIYSGDHAIHEILLYMDNDPKMDKIIQPIMKSIVGYLKHHKDATFENVMDDYKDDMATIILSAPIITSFNATTAKKAKCFVLQSVLHRIDDEYDIRPKDWDFAACNINDLNW